MSSFELGLRKMAAMNALLELLVIMLLVHSSQMAPASNILERKRRAISAQDASYIHPGSCYSTDILMETLHGTCTDEASCRYDTDCPDSRHKCCRVDITCGQERQCVNSMPDCTNPQGWLYRVNEVEFRDQGCIKCVCVLENEDFAEFLCKDEDSCINGQMIDKNSYINFNSVNNHNPNDEGAVIIAGIAGMDIAIEASEELTALGRGADDTRRPT